MYLKQSWQYLTLCVFLCFLTFSGESFSKSHTSHLVAPPLVLVLHSLVSGSGSGWGTDGVVLVCLVIENSTEMFSVGLSGGTGCSPLLLLKERITWSTISNVSLLFTCDGEQLEWLHDSLSLQTLLLWLISLDFLYFSLSRNSLPPHRNWLPRWQALAPGCRDGDDLPWRQGYPVPHREPKCESWSVWKKIHLELTLHCRFRLDLQIQYQAFNSILCWLSHSLALLCCVKGPWTQNVQCRTGFYPLRVQMCQIHFQLRLCFRLRFCLFNPLLLKLSRVKSAQHLEGKTFNGADQNTKSLPLTFWRELT